LTSITDTNFKDNIGLYNPSKYLEMERKQKRRFKHDQQDENNTCQDILVLKKTI